jgi:hypothetical protein
MASHATAVNDGTTAEVALDARARDVLDFEREWWRYAGHKEEAIRDRFELTPTRYYQLLGEVIDSPDALTYDPMLVKRLRRLRAARHRDRAARRADAAGQ